MSRMRHASDPRRTRRVSPRPWLAAALLALAAGCTPAEAAPFGKLLFATMVAFLIAIPIVFVRAWRRRRRRD